MSALLLSGLGTLAVMIGYVIVKRLRRSRCASHTKLCDCESPELKLQKENTIRIDELMQIIMKTTPADPENPEPLTKDTAEVLESTTTSKLP